MRDGVVAAVFGAADTARLVRRLATGQIVEAPILASVPVGCPYRSLIGTPEGWLFHCDDSFFLLDPTGTVVASSPASPFAKIATNRGAALTIALDSRDVETRDVSTTIAQPMVLFEGQSRDLEGCSATRPSGSLLVMLALAGVARRRRSR